ncbi:MAG: hypothetical protein AAF657_17505 [Acidobacteriota bacterium]
MPQSFLRCLLALAVLSLIALPLAAQPQINEIRIDQPGDDDDEYFELSGTPSSSLDGFTYLVIGDGAGGSGVIEEVTDLTGQSLSAGGFFVAAEGTFSLATADLTTSLNFENSDNVTHLLVSGFSGSDGQDLDTDDDGTLDVTPWTQVDDCLALIENAGAGELTYCATTLGPDDTFVPGHPILCPGGWEIGAFTPLGADDTPGTANACTGVTSVAINEIRIDQTGDPDGDEYFELLGAPLAALDGLTYLVIGDGAGGSGVIEEVIDLTGSSLAASGFFVAAEATFSLGAADLTTDLAFENSDNVTHLVVSSFTGALDQDLDTNDDGVLDLTPWSQLIDCVALIETVGSGDQVYCPETVGPDGTFVPGHAFLCPAGWDIGVFDPVGTNDTPGAANVCTGTAFEIFDIQGGGAASPVAGQLVTTNDNIVTAVGLDGFFIQTPDARDDLDPDTSNGIFVFTDTAPTVAVGDQVDVTAQATEFFDFTELTGSPIVSIDSSGNPLPTAIVFDVTRPSPDPESPSCALEFECYEGMLVTVTDGWVCSGNQTFGTDPIAEVFASAGERCFRETGVEFPGLAMPPIPIWDGNPEVFELDPDRLGLPNLTIGGGSTFDATGVIGFEFGDYELWPSSLSVNQATLPRAVPERLDDKEFTIGSLNLFRLFDDVDDPEPEDDGQVATTEEYQRRLGKFSAYIRQVLDSPEVLAIQEVEKLGVLQDLAAQIALDDPLVDYRAELIDGNDVGGIDVGFLLRETITLVELTQLGADERLTFDDSLLHDRPPLLLEAEYSRVLPPSSATDGPSFAFAVMCNHMRSLSGIDDPGSGPRVRQKRLEQAQSIAQKTQDFQTANPDVPLVIIGDLNAFEFTDGYVDVLGQLVGNVDPTMNLLSGPDLVDPNLVSWAVAGLSPSERYSFNFGGNAQVLDHALTSSAARGFVRRIAYGRGNADAARDLFDQDGTALRSSDHDGLVLYLNTVPELFADGFESGDLNGWSLQVP